MTALPLGKAHKIIIAVLALLLPVLYLIATDADNISGLFGIFWMDESIYMMAAKNQALFGSAHPFAADHWLPELRTPLAHYLGVRTITSEHLMLWPRFVTGVCVLLGAALIANLAGKYYGNRWHGLICFVCILLNPILFFYARLALSEGLQFFIVALILTVLFALHKATRFSQAMRLAGAGGLLAGALFVSKISSVTACAALSIGAGLAIYLNPSISRKIAVGGFYIAGGIAAVTLFFFGYVGSQFDPWWSINMADGLQAIDITPQNLTMLASALSTSITGIFAHLCLMPIFAFYFLSLVMIPRKERGFLFILGVITVILLFLDPIYGAVIRRNFFSLTLLSAFFGFVCADYLSAGIARNAPDTVAQKAGIFLFAAHILCAASFAALFATFGDWLYVLLTTIFILISLLALFAAGAASRRARHGLALVALLCALLPMLFQDFLAPYTRREVNEAIEAATPPDAIIAGVRAPAYFEGRRRVALANCVHAYIPVSYGNDVDLLANEKYFYYLSATPQDHDSCGPADLKRYTTLGSFEVFYPDNEGFQAGPSFFWKYKKRFFLYQKP